MFIKALSSIVHPSKVACNHWRLLTEPINICYYPIPPFSEDWSLSFLLIQSSFFDASATSRSRSPELVLTAHLCVMWKGSCSSRATARADRTDAWCSCCCYTAEVFLCPNLNKEGTLLNDGRCKLVAAAGMKWNHRQLCPTLNASAASKPSE